jgi:hypothetical protein
MDRKVRMTLGCVDQTCQSSELVVYMRVLWIFATSFSIVLQTPYWSCYELRIEYLVAKSLRDQMYIFLSQVLVVNFRTSMHD